MDLNVQETNSYAYLLYSVDPNKNLDVVNLNVGLMRGLGVSSFYMQRAEVE